jgi:hypothetical protein
VPPPGKSPRTVVRRARRPRARAPRPRTPRACAPGDYAPARAAGCPSPSSAPWNASRRPLASRRLDRGELGRGRFERRATRPRGGRGRAPRDRRRPPEATAPSGRLCARSSAHPERRLEGRLEGIPDGFLREFPFGPGGVCGCLCGIKWQIPGHDSQRPRKRHTDRAVLPREEPRPFGVEGRARGHMRQVVQTQSSGGRALELETRTKVRSVPYGSRDFPGFNRPGRPYPR